ncbi:peroxisomal membrane protein PEX14-like [Vespa velutina]|uniref:peroxisomal membrane protein PEX14-like n=1 Tax=Vespa velutina TaxID=202808 RepID=UPI001FB29D24|nr:peroxisomal membrane protein PEX14-like [Vespa velutina]
MFSWMKSSSNVRVNVPKTCSLSKPETKSIISEFSSLMELNQTNVTNEDQAISVECTKIVLRSALKKPKSNNENNFENIERIPKKVTFLLDEEYKKKDKDKDNIRKKSKLHKNSSTKPMNLDDESDYSNDTSMDEIVGACKRKIDSTCSKTKLSSPPISTCSSLESFEDDTKITGSDLSNELKENGIIVNSVLKISSANKKIIKYIYTKVKNWSKPSTSKTSDNEKSEQAKKIEMSKITDSDTFLDEEFIKHIEYDELENPANTTTANTTTANTTTANTTIANTTIANTTIANTTIANTTIANTTIANTTIANTTIANTTIANTTIANTTIANTTTANTTTANTTTANASAVGELLFGVNLTHKKTFDDMYEFCQKDKCSSSQNYLI